MYGIGLNPVYIQRMEEREAKRRANGQAAKEAEDASRAQKVGALFEEGPSRPPSPPLVLPLLISPWR